MATILVMIGTQLYWRDDEAREYRPLGRSEVRLSFASSDHLERAVGWLDQTRPDTPASLTVSIGTSPGYCAECRDWFVGACNCGNVPEAEHPRRRQRT